MGAAIGRRHLHPSSSGKGERPSHCSRATQTKESAKLTPDIEAKRVAPPVSVSIILAGGLEKERHDGNTLWRRRERTGAARVIEERGLIAAVRSQLIRDGITGQAIQ